MTRKYGGSGLGLTIAKSLTELMGGDLGGGEPGGGEGPRSRRQYLSSAGMATPRFSERACESSSGTACAHCGGQRDEPDHLAETDLVVGHAERHHPNRGRRPGPVAVRRPACGRQYDLALLDMKLPGINGRELARRIKADPLDGVRNTRDADLDGWDDT